MPSCQPRWLWLLWGVMLLSALWQVEQFGRTKSATFDETFYAGCAANTAARRHIDPVLAWNGVAPLPVLLCHVPAAWLVEVQPRSNPWSGSEQDVRLLRVARRWNALITVGILMSILFIWIWRRQHGIAALLAGGIAAFSPGLLAHASVAATDGLFCAMWVAAIAFLVWHVRKPTCARGLGLASITAILIATKYSGIIFLGVIFVSVAICETRPANAGVLARYLRSGIRAAWKTGGVCVACVPMVWLLHGFSVSSLTPQQTLEQTPAILRPSPITGIVFQYVHNRTGHPAYLLGRNSTSGWWYYHPAVMAFKSTPIELVLLVATLGLVAWGVASVFRGVERLDESRTVWYVSFVVLLAAFLGSNVCIGQRYVLPLYPLSILIVVDSLAAWRKWGSSRKWREAAVISGCALLIQAFSALLVSPHYLAYFSPIVGGASQGERFLVDSNLDWGQDLPQLRNEMRRLGYRRVAFQYFGTASPSVYGVDSVPLGPNIRDCQAIAISKTFLWGAYTGGRDPFRKFRDIAPIGSAGYSIAIYDLKDVRVREATRFAIAVGVPR